jgi:hypothetical protein
MPKTRCVDITKICPLEAWAVELGGMISALSITIDALNDCPESNSVELDAANGILCSLLKLKKEFDALYSDISNSAVTNIPKEIAVFRNTFKSQEK